MARLREIYAGIWPDARREPPNRSAERRRRPARSALSKLAPRASGAAEAELGIGRDAWERSPRRARAGRLGPIGRRINSRAAAEASRFTATRRHSQRDPSRGHRRSRRQAMLPATAGSAEARDRETPASPRRRIERHERVRLRPKSPAPVAGITAARAGRPRDQPRRPPAQPRISLPPRRLTSPATSPTAGQTPRDRALTSPAPATTVRRHASCPAPQHRALRRLRVADRLALPARPAPEGGISVIAWYALIGVMLGVATLIVVQAVMIGFREEFTDRILGANAHVTVYYAPEPDDRGTPSRLIPDYDALTARLAAVPGVTHAAPLIRGQVMISANGRASGVEVLGTRLEDLAGGAAGRASRDRRRRSRAARRAASPSAPASRASSASASATSSRSSRPRAWTRPSAPSRGSATTRSSTSSASAATTSTAPASTCRFAEAQSFFDREGARRRDRGDGRATPTGVEELVPALAAAAGAARDALDLARRLRRLPLRARRRAAGDVHHPLAGGADRRAQHHLRPGHAGEEQGPRHRHPAHHGPHARARSCGSSSSAAR